MFSRTIRYIRNGLDLFLAWILWGPTRMTTFFSVALGVRLSILPRFAQRSFTRALRLKFYRTAVEIITISGIPVSQSTLGDLLDQCLARGYFARAALLAPLLETAKRKILLEKLLFCDQLELAEAVAQIEGESIPEETAAHIANRLRVTSARERDYAARIKVRTMQTKENPSSGQTRPHRYH